MTNLTFATRGAKIGNMYALWTLFCYPLTRFDASLPLTTILHSQDRTGGHIEELWLFFGHSSIPSSLFQFGLAQSPTCSCDSAIPQAVFHMLIGCPLFLQEMFSFRQNVLGGDQLPYNDPLFIHQLQTINDGKRT